jgi:dephospho-CoA kinase
MYQPLPSFKNLSTVTLPLIPPPLIGAMAAVPEALEAIVHPCISELARSAIEQHRQSGESGPLVLDAPLLLEVGWDRLCDWVLLVDTPSQRRLQWATQRGWSEAEWKQREASQWSLDRKRAAATHCIRNDGSVETLADQVDALLASWSN